MNNLTKVFYKGKVNLQLKIKDQIISIDNHNAGLLGLSLSFCKFITGNSITENDIPIYIDLTKSDEEFDIGDSILINKIRLSGRFFELDPTSNNYVAKFNAVISNSSLTETISRADSNYFKLILYTAGNPQTALATMNVSAETLSLITPGTQAIVEWSMMLDLG